jgi:hypothetical protein
MKPSRDESKSAAVNSTPRFSAAGALAADAGGGFFAAGFRGCAKSCAVNKPPAMSARAAAECGAEGRQFFISISPGETFGAFLRGNRLTAIL